MTLITLLITNHSAEMLAIVESERRMMADCTVVVVVVIMIDWR